MKINKKIEYVIVFTLIIIGLITIILIKFNNNTNNISFDNKIVPKSFTSELFNIANNKTLANKTSFGSTNNFPISMQRLKLTKLIINNSNKTDILYIGSDACPFCAVTRWSLIIALMRFGNFTNLHYMTSSSKDIYPSTPTFTFYNSTFYSNTINFISVEEQTNTEKQLQMPTAQEILIFKKLNIYNQLLPHYARGGIPFIDFGNSTVSVGALVSPALIYKQNWNTIISQIKNLNSSDSKAIIGAANIFTAEICGINNNVPLNICNQNYVKTIQKNLNIK